jgi:hypothetical protein
VSRSAPCLAASVLLGLAALQAPGQIPATAEAPAVAAHTAPQEDARDDAATPLTPATRDPFWPVGYTPPPPRSADDPPEPATDRPPPDWTAARKLLEVTMMSRRGDRFFASLRGIGLVQEGDNVAVRDRFYVYKFHISAINERGIAAVPVETRERPR